MPITARLVADVLTVAGADRVLTMDLRRADPGVLQHPGRRADGRQHPVAVRPEKNLPDIVVVSELGFAKKRATSPRSSRRRWRSSRKAEAEQQDKTELMNIIGEVAGQPAVIIDDEIDTGGSLP